jgi:hypothetical protein
MRWPFRTSWGGGRVGTHELLSSHMHHAFFHLHTSSTKTHIQTHTYNQSTFFAFPSLRLARQQRTHVASAGKSGCYLCECVCACAPWTFLPSMQTTIILLPSSSTKAHQYTLQSPPRLPLPTFKTSLGLFWCSFPPGTFSTTKSCPPPLHQASCIRIIIIIIQSLVLLL